MRKQIKNVYCYPSNLRESDKWAKPMAAIWRLKLGPICLFFHSCNPVPFCKNDQHVHWKAGGQERGGRWREADNDLRTWRWDLLPRRTPPLPRSCLSFPICDMMALVAWDSEVSSRSIAPRLSSLEDKFPGRLCHKNPSLFHTMFSTRAQFFFTSARRGEKDQFEGNSVYLHSDEKLTPDISQKFPDSYWKRKLLK